MAKSTKKKEQPAAGEVKPATDAVQQINLKDLLPNPYQPVGRLNPLAEELEKLQRDIHENGLHYPIIVRKKGAGKYEVADGWQRVCAYRNLVKVLPKFGEVPARVEDLDDQDMADMIPSSAINRPLTPIDLANYYKRYIEEFKVTQSALAERMHVTQGEIANTIRLLDLPADIQTKIISQEISETHGRQLLRLNYNAELQQKVLGETIKEGYSVNQLSNEVARKMYHESENLDPDDYPKPAFDITECEKCPSRQKIGSPYSNEKKTWRCLDKECYQKKTKQAEKARIDQMQTDIAAAKKEAGDKKKGGVLDLDKLTWRDYQELGRDYHKIVNPKECETCPKRALGKMDYRDKTEMVCIDVKCFKAKEKAYQDKAAAKAREDEKKLTERVRVACLNLRDESTPFKLIVEYLLGHCRKDTREKFGRMYDLKVDNIAHWFDCNISDNEPEVIIRTAALVLTLERYEGEKGVFRKMLADLEGTSAELDKALDAHRAKHCKGCIHDDGKCRQLLKRYGEGWHDKCYHYSKAPEKEEAESNQTLEQMEQEADESLAASEKQWEAEAEAELAEAEARQERAKEFEVDKADLGEQELLSFQFKYCDGCHWADQAKVGTGQPCCTFITTPHIVDGECRTRKVEGSTSDNASDSKDPLDNLVIHTATDGEKQHSFKLGETGVRGKTLRGCVLALGKHMGWGSTAATILENLRNLPTSQNSELLISILEGDDSPPETPKVKKDKLPKLCSFDDCTLKEKCEHYEPGKSKKNCKGYETELTSYPAPGGGSTVTWYHCKYLPEDMWPEIARKARQAAE